MKTTMKKISAMIMALAMVAAMAVPAFAADAPQTETITVTITLQTWDKTQTGKAGEPQKIFEEPVTVTIEKGQTVKDAVNKIPGLTIVTCVNDGEYGCVHTNGQCACTANGDACNCTWTQVQNVDADYKPIEGSYSSVLNSMKFGYTYYTNNGGSVENANGTHTYTGTAWEYYVGSDYPEDEYMSQYTLETDTNIILSFTKSSFNW